MNDWVPLLTVVTLLAALWLLARQVSMRIQALGWLLAGHASGAVYALWLTLLPGIVLHEVSHWLTAWLLGLRATAPDLVPRRYGKHIRLGSVTVTSGGHLLDSIVGLAPFLVGGICVFLLGNRLFDATGIVHGVMQDGVTGAWRGLLSVIQLPEGYLWLYLTFAISNAMFPSPSDTEPVRPVLSFAGLLVSLALIAGWTPQLSSEGVTAINRGLLVLSEAFVFTLVVDVAFLLLLAVLEQIAGAVSGQRLTFESTSSARRRRRQ